jgi:arginine exporter protein ArgO
MNAWIEPNIAPWFSFLSLLSLLSLLAPLAQRGVHKTFVIGVYAAAVALGLICLGLTGVAVLSEQPPYVVLPLFVVGFILTVVFAATFPMTVHAYRDAEHRKIAAKDM